MAARFAAGDATREGFAVRRRRQRIEPTERDEQGAGNGAQTGPHVVMAPSNELHRLSSQLRASPRRSAASCAELCETLIERIRSQKLGCVAAVGEVQPQSGLLVCRRRCHCVQRRATASGATGGSAQQRHRFMRAGHVTANSRATIPPKLMPNTSVVGQPT